MSKILLRLAWIGLFSMSVAVAAFSDLPKFPLEASRLLALVAGNALPENVVDLIHARGLGFQPTSNFRALLTRAGATPEIMNA